MNKDKRKEKILFALSILFIFIIPAALIVLSAQWLGRTWIRPEEVEEEVGQLNPSRVLADKFKYRDQSLVVRGQVVPETAVCERKPCPDYDPCCGCDNERDLIIVDSGTSSMAQSPGRLRLLNPEKEVFCYRETNSCRYECGDWRLGEVYVVRGFFRATPPPLGTGLKLYFDYYFEVHEKELVRTLDIFEKTKGIVNDLKNFILKTKTTGYYILR